MDLSAGYAPAPREWALFARRLARRRTALFGLVVVLIVIVAALGASWIAGYDPTEQDITNRLRAPGSQDAAGRAHLFGTDHLGRDILARMIFGARPALMVGFAAVAISGVLGMMVGLLSGYFGGWIDDVFMRLADVQLAFPFILLAIAVIGVLGPSLPVIIVVIGVSSWVIYARVVRGAVLSLREREFVQAAHALGSRDGRVLLRHILPNAFTPWLVVATLDMARVIVIESALSFLGLGVQPPTPTWGGMLADGRVYISTAWWLATFPGLAILVTVLGINLFGDGLRDTLDPRRRPRPDGQSPGRGRWRAYIRRASRRRAAAGDVSQSTPDGMPASAFTTRKAPPPSSPAQSRSVVARSAVPRQPRRATPSAKSVPIPSIATSVPLAVRVGTRDWWASSRIAHPRLIANAIHVVARGLRPRPRTSARNQSAPKTAYSERCPPLRASPCRASSWAGAAHGASIRRIGTSQCSVCSALPTSDESHMITAIQRAGGSQYVARTPL